MAMTDIDFQPIRFGTPCLFYIILPFISRHQCCGFEFSGFAEIVHHGELKIMVSKTMFSINILRLKTPYPVGLQDMFVSQRPWLAITLKFVGPYKK